MKIEINNRQKLAKLNRPRIRQLIRYLTGKISRLDPTVWEEISIMTTDDTGIKLVNRKHLNSTDVTDVISFRYEPMPGINTACTGEIIVNVERALEITQKMKKRNACHELALYMAHGFDHLANQTDHDSAGKCRMRHRELRWLKTAPWHGILKS